MEHYLKQCPMDLIISTVFNKRPSRTRIKRIACSFANNIIELIIYSLFIYMFNTNQTLQKMNSFEKYAYNIILVNPVNVNIEKSHIDAPKIIGYLEKIR